MHLIVAFVISMFIGPPEVRAPMAPMTWETNGVLTWSVASFQGPEILIVENIVYLYGEGEMWTAWSRKGVVTRYPNYVQVDIPPPYIKVDIKVAR